MRFTHFGNPTALDAGDELVLYRNRELPMAAFFRGPVRLLCGSADGRSSEGICGSFLHADVLDPGNGACRAFARLIELLTGKSLEQLPTEATMDRYGRAFEHPCVAWRVR